VGDRRDGGAALGEEHQARAAVARVGAALDVAGALELLDCLGHRLLAHPGPLGEGGDRDALRGHEREDVPGRGADVVEPGLAQRGFDLLGVALVDESQEQADQGTVRTIRFHR